MAVTEAVAPKARGLPGATVLQILPALAETPAARAAVDRAVALLRSGARVIVAAEEGPLNSELQSLGGEWVRLVTATTNPLSVTRNACISYIRGPRKKQPMQVGTSSLEQLVGEVKTRTQTLIRTETKDRFAALRAALDPDDQTLLILRIDRKLPWRDIARILEPTATTPEQLDRTSATLRKRLERLKDELRAQLK